MRRRSILGLLVTAFCFPSLSACSGGGGASSPLAAIAATSPPGAALVAFAPAPIAGTTSNPVSAASTAGPTAAPGASSSPTPVASGSVVAPSARKTALPTPVATTSPTLAPTAAPTVAPTTAPTVAPPTPTPTQTATPVIAPAGTVPFASGPFNNAVSSPILNPNSSTYLSNVMGNDYGHIGKLQFATNTSGVTDDNTPIYIAHNSDPVYTIHCMYYSNCPLEGVQEHIPVSARASSNIGNTTFLDDGHDDMHMAVRNVDTGVEIDTWLTPQPNGTGGTLDVGYGGRYAFSSGGYNQPGGATAAGFALANGRIRAVDLLAGHIPYAIFMITPCENGYVSPASGSDGGPVAGCPPLGSHVWLDSTASQIAASGAAPDFQVILNALHEYGGFIGDRCTSCNLTVGIEGGLSATAFGQPNPWAKIAAHFPSESPTSGEYHILISSGSIDLSQHLHIITN